MINSDKMLADLGEMQQVADKYNIPFEDVFFLDLNFSGINLDVPYSRVRFTFRPQNHYFQTSAKRNESEYFFGLPVRPKSKHKISISDNNLFFDTEMVGKIEGLANDTCDTTYPRRGGTVMNLNANSKSTCHGCAFCHTLKQTPKDREDVSTESALRNFIDKWLQKYNINDLSNLQQVAVVTGCFGSEQKTVDHLTMVRKVFADYGYHNEIFYFGSEIRSDAAFEKLKREVDPFAMCISVECFTNRERMLRDIKRDLTMEEIARMLKKSKELGFKTNFSYILGLEPISTLKKGFEELLPLIDRFPVINVFQPHTDGQEILRNKDAWSIDYYMQARETLEKIFSDTDMRPRPWENYRGLWYLEFNGESLHDIRIP